MVLDMSGSMSSVHMPVIEGVNQYIEDLKNDDSGETLFSLTAFDTVFEHWHVAEPVESIGSIANRYQPRGGTALYDGIAHSIIETERKIKKMKRGDMKILHVTVTDGGENSSHDYRCSCDYAPCHCGKDEGRKRLQQLVKEKEASGNWTFVYLGAGHSSVAAAQRVAGGMGYARGNSMMYTSTPGGVTSTTDSLSAMTHSRRVSADNSSVTAFADAGLTAQNFSDPAAAGTSPPPSIVIPATPPHPVVPQAGDVLAEVDKLKSSSLGDALGGK